MNDSSALDKLDVKHPARFALYNLGMRSGDDPTTDILRANLLHIFELDGIGPRSWNAQARATGLTNNGCKNIIERGSAASTTVLDTLSRHLGIPAALLLLPQTRTMNRAQLMRFRRLLERAATSSAATIELMERVAELGSQPAPPPTN